MVPILPCLSTVRSDGVKSCAYCRALCFRRSQRELQFSDYHRHKATRLLYGVIGAGLLLQTKIENAFDACTNCHRALSKIFTFDGFKVVRSFHLKTLTIDSKLQHLRLLEYFYERKILSKFDENNVKQPAWKVESCRNSKEEVINC